jgi:hypothetical protein
MAKVVVPASEREACFLGEPRETTERVARAHHPVGQRRWGAWPRRHAASVPALHLDGPVLVDALEAGDRIESDEFLRWFRLPKEHLDQFERVGCDAGVMKKQGCGVEDDAHACTSARSRLRQELVFWLLIAIPVSSPFSTNATSRMSRWLITSSELAKGGWT